MALAVVSVVDNAITVSVAGSELLAPYLTAASASAAAAASSQTGAASSAISAANSAVIAAAAVGTVYATVAAGLAATASGSSFTVADGSGSKLAAVYRDDAGVATLLYSIPTIGGVPSLAHWQRFLAKIANGNENVSCVLTGDSTGDATTEWYYLIATSIAALYPTHTVQHRLWNVAGDVYDAATTIQTGTGARTITFYNGSVAGSVANYFAGARFTGAVQTPAPDLVFASYGHNGGLAQRQLSFYDTIAYSLRTRLPDTPVIQIGQNPTLSDETMAAKISVFRDFAARNGWGFISVHDAFKQAGVALSTLLADEVHPNATGSALWRDTVLGSMQASRAAFGGGSITPSAMIRSWSTFADFDKWTKSNATLSSETAAGFYETAGQSAKLTTTSTAAAGYAYTTAATSADAPAYANKYVTLSVWQRVPDGNISGSGRVEIEDDAGSTVSTGVLQGVGFNLFTVTRKITAAPTFIKTYYYSADAAAASANVVYLDRASLSLGLTPIDPLSPLETSTRYHRIYGSSAGGVAAVYNAASSGTAVQVVSSETANPETGYAASLSADGLKVKAEANAFDRVAVGLSGLRFGGGAAATDMGIDRQLAGIMRFSGGDLYPDANGTRYIGGNGAEFRAIFVKDGLYINNNLILGPQGAAIPNITTTATAGTLPTPDGTVTIANAATPTVVELLEYCVELEAKVEAHLARARAGTPSIAT